MTQCLLYIGDKLMEDQDPSLMIKCLLVKLSLTFSSTYIISYNINHILCFALKILWVL